MRLSKPVAIALLLATVALVAAAVWLTPRDTGKDETTWPAWYPAMNADGDPAFAEFQNHVPCAIDTPPAVDCQRVKLGLVLYRDASTRQPTTYLMSVIRVGVSDEREVHEGTWSIDTGTGLDPAATVYRLDRGAPEGLRDYWSIGGEILFVLDSDLMPRVGDAANGFALNRIPGNA